MQRTLVPCLMLALATVANAQPVNNPCVESSTQYCTAQPSVGFGSVAPVSICLGQGASASVSHVFSTGTVQTVTVNLDCSVVTTYGSATSTVQSNWWQASVGSYSTSGTGLSANFTPSSAGTGSITFYTRYANTFPCTTSPATVSKVVSLTVTAEGGPHYGAWSKVQDGTLATAGTIELTNMIVCVGETVNIPDTYGFVFNNGSKRRQVSYDCASNQNLNGWQTNAVTYTASEVYFDPPLPSVFTTAQTNTYTAKVNGIPTGGVCATISNIVVGSLTVIVASTGDSDYDGFSDCQEMRNGTDPFGVAASSKMWLGYWTFNTTNWSGEFGQTALIATNLQLLDGYNLNAVSLTDGVFSGLVYREIETNGWANINLREGTVRFWFRPGWTSTSSGGAGPQAEGRLIELGNESTGTPAGWWALVLNSAGTQLRFVTQSTGTLQTNVTATVNWKEGEWHQVALAYTPTNSAIYVDGVLKTSGSGVSNYPSSTVRADGFKIGSDTAGAKKAKGRFDDLETFNYPLTSTIISNHYTWAVSQHNSLAAANANACVLRPITVRDTVTASLTNGATFTMARGTGPGNFSWVEANQKGNTNPKTMAQQLTNATGFAFIQSDNPADTVVSIGDEISGIPGKRNASAVRKSLDWLIANQVVITLPIWSTYRQQGANLDYTVSGYANFRLLSYGNVDESDLSKTNSTFTFVYLGTESCDQRTNAAPVVYAGLDGSVCHTNAVTLNGYATDDGLPAPATLSFAWSKVSGPGTVLFANQTATNTTATFSLPGQYRLRLVASDGQLTGSDTADFLVKELTTASGPTNIVACAGANVAFQVAASGTGPFSYVWMKNGTNLVGQVASTLSLTNINSGSAATYSVVVTGSCNAVTNSATLQVGGLAASGPNGSTNCPGTTATFTVTPSGTGPFTYAWYYNTNTISGATSNTLILTNLTLLNAGLYKVVVNGACGVLTNSATLVMLTNTSAVGPVANAVCPGGNATFTTVASGSGPFTYAWRKNGTNLVGKTASSLSLSNIISGDAGTYSVVVSGACTSVTNSAALTVNALTTTTSLTNVTVSLGGTAVFSTTPSGTGPFSFIWRKDGTVLAGKTTGSLTITNAMEADEGLYSVTVAGACNSVTNSATLEVAGSLPPVVNIFNPTNNQVFFAPALVLLKANASDPDGTISSVEFFQGTNSIGFGTLGSGSYNLTLNNVAHGLYSFTAVATDNHGNKATSSVVSIIVGRVNSRTYTIDADFDGGTMINVNHTTPTNNQLQLNQRVTPFPFVNIACSTRGTVIRIDVNTGEILGEYWTSPDGMGRNPSRTTVDKFGNVWVGNRNENSGSQGSLTRIGVVIGGTRGHKNSDGSFTPNMAGQYIKPPFYYNTCIDKDGDGLIRTSRGRADILPWSNTNLSGINIDSDGDRTNSSGVLISGVSTAEDEAIINYVRVPGGGTRTLAIDKNNDIWVGSYDSGEHVKVDGHTGLKVPGTTIDIPDFAGHGHPGYGGLIDGNGVLWTSRPLTRFDPVKRFDFSVNPPLITNSAYLGVVMTNNYGVAVDPQTGYIWTSEYGGSYRPVFSPAGVVVTNHYHGEGQGLTVDDRSNVWFARSSSYVGHLRTDGTWVGEVPLPCGAQATGVAVDSNGKIWVADLGANTAMRIDPNRGPKMLDNQTNSSGYFLGEVDLTVNLGSDAGPYNYSDMTGFTIIGTTAREGNWTVVNDNEVTGTEWSVISWNATNYPGTSIRVEARAADTILGLAPKAFVQVTNGVPFYGQPNFVGRYIEMRTLLRTEVGNTNSPVLYDLTVICTNLPFSTVTNIPPVRPNNAQPIAGLDAPSVPRNSYFQTLDVLANDTDADGDNLTISAITPPAYGIAHIAPDGKSIIYTPDPLYFGKDLMTYTVIDGFGGLARASVQISVDRFPPGSPTAAVDDQYVFDETNGQVEYYLNVLDNDVAPLPPLIIAPLSNTRTTNGVLTMCSTHFKYKPDADFSGIDGFDYTTIDVNGVTRTAHVRIIIRNVDNDAPVDGPGNNSAGSDYFEVNEDSTNNILAVVLDDSDPEGDTFSITAVSTPAYGTVSIVQNGQALSYTPPPNFSNYQDYDYLSYQISDTNGANSTVQVYINVLETNDDPPTAVADMIIVDQNATASTHYLTSNDTDPEYWYVYLNSITQPANGTVVTNEWSQYNGDISFTPQTGFYGSNSFTYVIRDEGNATATGNVLIFVRKTTDTAPNAVSDYFSVLPNTLTNVLNVLQNDTDAESQPLALVNWTQPSKGLMVRSGTNLLYTPRAGFVGDDYAYYWVADSQGGISQGYISIKVRTNTPPVARNDSDKVNAGSNVDVSVLSNDSDVDPDDYQLRVISVSASTNGGTMTIINNGTQVRYTPGTGTVGNDAFNYTIADKIGATATAQVLLYVNPPGNTAPYAQGDYYTIAGNSLSNYFNVLANDSDANNHSFEIVAGYTQPANGTLQAFPTHFVYIPNQDFIGNDSFSYRIADSLDGLSDFATVSISVVQDPSAAPVAVITSPVEGPGSSDGFNEPEYPVVRDGILSVTGTATDPDAGDPFRYEIRIYNASTGQEVARKTGNTRVSNGALGAVSLGHVKNGIYDVTLEVFGGHKRASDQSRFILDSDLKIGHFSFSVQDVRLSVSGVPLTVTRTYNSLNDKVGEFGHSWTYSLANMDIELDEDRAITESIFGDDFSMRVGGRRNVILTLPGGKRTVFYFTLEAAGIGTFEAVYKASPGVHATLVPKGDRRLIALFGAPFWQATGPYTYWEYYDFPGFTLTMQDGTKYEIERPLIGEFEVAGESGEDSALGVTAYGDPYLERIVYRNNTKVVFTSTSVQFLDSNDQVTKTLVLEKTNGKITAIRDPNSDTGPATMKYEYDGIGNLHKVLTLVDRTAGLYVTNKYHYTNSNFPHFITDIENANGQRVAKNFYDNDGKLYAIEDAAGRRTLLIQDGENRKEIIVDRLGNTNIHHFDTRGNVTETVSPLGITNRFAYNDLNLRTNMVVVGLQTNNFEYNGSGLLTQTTVGNLVTNYFDFNGYGQLLSAVDAMGRGTTNDYDPAGNILKKVKAFTTNSYTYNENGDITSEVLSTGSYSTNHYDHLGNITNRLAISASGEILAAARVEYDDNGNITKEIHFRTLQNGTKETNATSFVYDPQNRRIHTIDPFGKTNSVVYNALGQKFKEIDALGRITQYDYDLHGNLYQTTYPDQTFERSFYDAEGRLTNSLSRSGLTTTYKYDAVGRPTHTINPDGTTNFVVYDGLGRMTISVNERGVTNAIGYNSAGHRVAVTNALGANQQVFQYRFDASGNVTNTIDPLGRITTNVFDAERRLIEVHLPNGSKTFTAYNFEGQVSRETDAAGRIKAFGYNSAGRLIAVTNAFGLPEEAVTRYTYDENGWMLTQTDAENRVTKYDYDALGRRIWRKLPLGMIETVKFDAVGNITNKLNFKNKATTYEYDIAGRLKRRIPDSSLSEPSIEFSYYPNGLRSNMVDNSGTTVYTYDPMGRLSQKQTPQGVLNYKYDKYGNLTNIYSGTTGGAALSYTYDIFNRLKTVVDSRGGTTTYEYDAVGNLKKLIMPNGVTNVYEFGSAYHLQSLAISNSAGQIHKYDYLVDRNNRRTNIVESDGRQVGYEFDGLYRLRQEKIQNALSLNGTVSYAYDKVGNRTNRTSSSGLVAVLPNQSLQMDLNDRLTSDVYDDNGNTLQTTLNNPYAGLQGTDQYNFENRLIRRTNGNDSVVLVYDGDGHKVRETVTKTGQTRATSYLVDTLNPTGYAQVLEEWVSTNGSTAQLDRVYNFGHDLLSQVFAPGVLADSQRTRYYIHDGGGSVAFLVNESGVPTDSYRYDAFGQLIEARVRNPQSGVFEPISALNIQYQTPNAYRFAGEQFTESLGLYYLRARLMNPLTGRMWTMDSYEGVAREPASLHKYMYANADPVNNIDPSGYESLASVTVGSSMASSLSAMYNGVVTATGEALQAAIIGAVEGKSVNDVVFGFVMDQTGLSTVFLIADVVQEIFRSGGYDEESAEIIAYQLWREEVILTFAYVVDDSEEGDFTFVFEGELEPQCFVAGTMVQTSSGAKAIDQLAPGEMVLAWDETTGETGLNMVRHRFSHVRDEIVSIVVGGETIQATVEHPFYLPSEGWVSAGDLQVGDLMVDKNMASVRVEAVQRLKGSFTVYNVEVDNAHTYFVGPNGILAHNASAAKLRKLLDMVDEPLLDAHHIVARNSSRAAGPKRVLGMVGIVDLDFVENGVALPRTLKAKKKLKSNAIPHHGGGVHSQKYNDKLEARLQDAYNRGRSAAGQKRCVIRELKKVGEELKLGIQTW